MTLEKSSKKKKHRNISRMRRKYLSRRKNRNSTGIRTAMRNLVSYLLAGAEGLEPSARGFGDDVVCAFHGIFVSAV